MNNPANSSDEELAFLLSDPDSPAFEPLVQRHAQPIYDFVLRLTLDAEAAGAITRQTFDYLRTQASQRLDDLSVRAWLLNYALERGLEALNADRPGTAKLSSGDRRFTQTDAGIDREAALWAWQAARSLRPRDYAVLDLTARRGLNVEELRGSAAQGRGGADTILSRAGEGFAEAYVATALYFRGRDACKDLAELVGGSGAGMRVGIRRQIASHVEDCSTCQATLESLPGAAGVLAALRDVGLPSELPDQIVAGTSAAAASQLGFDQPSSEEAEATELQPEENTEWAASEAGYSEPGDRGNGDLPADEEQSDSASEEELWARPEEAMGFAGVASSELPESVAEMEERYGVEPVDQPYEQIEVFEQGGTEYARDPYYRGYAPAPLTLRERLSGWFAPAYDQSFVLSYALVGVATAVAVYIGIAVASSLGGGGSAPSVAADEVREIACDTGPLSMEAGSTRLIEFDPESLDGYELSSVAVADRPATADEDALRLRVVSPTAINVLAASVSSSTARSDEYVLQMIWQRGAEDAVTDCPLTVNVPASTSPTTTPESNETPAAGETPEAEGTATP
jgi:hypothetical protein